jgi:hypothetical protein
MKSKVYISKNTINNFIEYQSLAPHSINTTSEFVNEKPIEIQLEYNSNWVEQLIEGNEMTCLIAIDVLDSYDGISSIDL